MNKEYLLSPERRLTKEEQSLIWKKAYPMWKATQNVEFVLL